VREPVAKMPQKGARHGASILLRANAEACSPSRRPIMNLTGMNLTGMNLTGMNLTGMNLTVSKASTSIFAKEPRT